MKKVFSYIIIFFISLSVFFLFSHSRQTPIYTADQCPGVPGGIRILDVKLDKTSVKTTDFITVSFTAKGDKDDAKYRVRVHADDAAQTKGGEIVWESIKEFTLNEGETVTDTVRIREFDPPALPDDTYIVRVRKSGGRVYCGQVGFSISSTDTSLPGTFQPGSPQDEIEFGITTLPRIAVSGLNEGGQYKFILSGQWRKDTIDEKGDTGRGKEFTAGLGGTIVVLDICDNGEANRQDCEDKFRSGSYRINVVKVSNSELVASTSFSISVKAISVPGLEAGEGKDVNVVASGFASTFLSFGIGIAGGIAFLLMVFGAYRLIFAGGNPDAMQQGKEIITAAIAGLLVIIFAVFILRFLGFTILGLGF